MAVVKKLSILGVACLCLTSCIFNNDDQSYLKSQNGPPLVVPNPMTTTNLGYFYHLPTQNQDARVSIEPPIVK